ncbi:MAG: SGNH/GDSL hydrolase family protein [Clostridiales bacterium]|nr:SGNH/GDSL hydrolase family protein [Clostridiales bacterium]
MKTILCFGDSNTYGYDPKTGLRYPRNIRWPGRLQEILSSREAHDCMKSYLLAMTSETEEKNITPSYTVIEEGCNGRTTVTDDPIEGWKNGLDYLKPCLNSHKPVDIVILMLGTNDLKEVFHLTAAEIAKNVGILVDTIKEFTREKQGFEPKIILVSPPHIGKSMPRSVFAGAFAPRSIEESVLFAKNYQAVAEEKCCIFFDAAACVEPSEEDALHLTEEAHLTLAEQLAKVVLSQEHG